MAADGLCQGWWWRRRVVGVVGAGGGGWSVSGVLSPANLTGQMASPASFATALIWEWPCDEERATIIESTQ